jgi:flavin reductase (DIM6/NTAB) family NADH-FMN oxidoreductase RutF
MHRPVTLHHLETAPAVSNPRHLRDCFAMFATGVTIITTRGASGELIGLTASSFNTLSLSPPMVLWSLGAQSTSLPMFRQALNFSVNVLESHQKMLAARFSQKNVDRFDGVQWHPGLNDIPLIDGALAWFECETRSVNEFGDHVLFVGEVLRCARVEGSPLLFRKGEYAISQTWDQSHAIKR